MTDEHETMHCEDPLPADDGCVLVTAMIFGLVGVAVGALGMFFYLGTC